MISTTGLYNDSSWPSKQVMGCGGSQCGQYWIYDYVSACTGQDGEGGRIFFDHSYAFSVEMGYSCDHPLTLEAYDAGGILLDSDTGPANLRFGEDGGNQDGPGVLRVDAPGSQPIDHVIIHDSSNFWIVDNIRLGSSLDVVKFDDVNELTECAGPGLPVMYTVGIASKYRDQTNVWITDALPREADFVSADPNTGTYDLLSHTYTWHLDTLAGYDPNEPNGPADPNTYFYLYTQINDMAEPAGEIVNKVFVESDQWETQTQAATPICCWGGDVVYVDRNAPGYYETGTDWSSAYRDLRGAIARINRGCGNVDTIRIADGTYYPGSEYSDTFEIPAGVAVYGGWAGYGAANPDERDPKKYRTILSGYIDETTRSNTVVKMGDGSLLDGVTVTEGGIHGIYGIGDNFAVKYCQVENNDQTGIYCESGNLTVQWSKIHNNGYHGIHHYANGKLLQVENCKVFENLRNGIRTDFSASIVINSLVYKNGSGSTYYGININNPSSNPAIRNNTIVDNLNEGIRFVGGNTPNIRNSILYYNNPEETNSPQLAGISTIYNCCIYDPNSQSSSADGNGNITCEPDFVYGSDPYGYYHIKYESYCREGGDSSVVGQNETDMDGEIRTQEYSVDIGADEVSCTDTWNPKDWTYDGVINYEEFAILSAAWLTQDPNSPTYPNPNNPDPNDVYAWYVINAGPKADLNGDSWVDLVDLGYFMDNWLWQACWRNSYMEVLGLSSGDESTMMATPALAATIETFESLFAPEKTLSQQIYDLEDSIKFLERLWLEDPYIQQEVDAQSWKEFMDAVYQNLCDLKDTSNK